MKEEEMLTISRQDKYRRTCFVDMTKALKVFLHDTSTLFKLLHMQ